MFGFCDPGRSGPVCCLTCHGHSVRQGLSDTELNHVLESRGRLTDCNATVMGWYIMVRWADFRILQPDPIFPCSYVNNETAGDKKFLNWSSIHHWRSTQLTCPVQFKQSSALHQCTSTKAVIFVTDRFRLHRSCTNAELRLN